ARKGEAALAAGRLAEARDAFREAAWQVPALPPDFPAHVSRVFGMQKLRHAQEITGLAYSPDGRRLASARLHGAVRVWDTATGRELRTLFHGASDFLLAVAYSPDGKTLAAAGVKSVRLWDAESGQDRLTLRGHTDAVTALAFSPDG